MQDNKDKSPHSWIIPVLEDIEAYAVVNDIPRIGAFITAARIGITHILDDSSSENRSIGAKEEQWLSTLLDELARYCDRHDLSNVKNELLSAHSAWHEAKAAKSLKDKVVTFLVRKD